MLSLRRALDGSLLRATLSGHRGLVRDVAFSPSGKQLATASPYDGAVRFWDVRDGRKLRRIDEATAKAVAFTPDGRRLAVARFHGGMVSTASRTAASSERSSRTIRCGTSASHRTGAR